ncbi:MAG: response regulator, partial [Fibrobacterota bacterium]
DDDKKIVRLFTEYLKNIDESFIVETAFNGYEACIKAGVLVPDIMVLDLNMPKVDGFEVVKNIKTIEETKHARIIICTGYASEENRKTLEGFGISTIIEKPVRFEEFKKAVLALTGNGR